MRRLFIALLLALPAGCTSGPPSTAGGPEAYCERQAENDPTVKQLEIQNMGLYAPPPDQQPDTRLAKRRALQKCLSEKGVQLRGGVEPVIAR